MRLTEPRAVVPVDRSQRYALLNDKPSDNAKTDLLGTSEAAQTIASVLIKSRGSSPFVMAIDGGWGIGKSTLLRQIEANLAHEKDLVCVRFNAWTAEGSNALEGLIKSVLGQLDPNTLRRSMRWLSKQQGVAGIARVLTMVAAHFLGVTRLVDELWSKLAIDAKSRNEMRELIGNMLTQWTQQDGKPDKALVVFIDDLDRCTDETIIQVMAARSSCTSTPLGLFSSSPVTCQCWLAGQPRRRAEASGRGAPTWRKSSRWPTGSRRRTKLRSRTSSAAAAQPRLALALLHDYGGSWPAGRAQSPQDQAHYQ